MSLARTDDRPRMQTGGGAQARRHGPTGEYLMPLNIEWTDRPPVAPRRPGAGGRVMAYDDNEHMPDEDRLRALLVGRSVTSAEVTDEKPEPYSAGPTGTLTLDDGTTLKVWGNDGGCGCDAGCYPLSALNAPGGVITNVEVEAKPDEDYTCPECKAEGRDWWDDCPHRGWYRVFVVTADERTLLASFDGSDGNGYYGTGWWLRVMDAA